MGRFTLYRKKIREKKKQKKLKVGGIKCYDKSENKLSREEKNRESPEISPATFNSLKFFFL